MTSQIHAERPWSSLLAFMAGAVAVAGLVAYLIVSQHREVLRSWEGRENGIADDRSRLVSHWLMERKADAELTARSLRVSMLLSGIAGQKTVRQLLEDERRSPIPMLDETKGSYGYSGVYILDREGRLVSQAAGSPEMPPTLGAAGRAAMERGQLQVDLLPDGPGRNFLGFVAPVPGKGERNGAGQRVINPLGAVALIMNPYETLYPLVTAETVATKTGETVLLMRKGDEVFYLSPLRNGPAGLHVVLNRPGFAAKASLEGGRTFGEYIDYQGVRVLAATRGIPLTGWGLVTKIDREEAWADFRHDAWMEAFAGALLLLALAGWFFAYHRYVWARLLKLEEEEFRALLESTPDGLVILDSESRMVFVNSQTERLFGYGRDELLGRSVTVLVPKETRGGEFPEGSAGAGDWSTAPRVEAEGRRKNGTVFAVEVGFSPVVGREGRLFCAAIRDLTERNKTEEVVQASEQRYRRYVERNAAAFLRVTLDGRLVECNDAAVRLVGYESREELLSHRTAQFYFTPADQQALVKLLKEQKALTNYEICWKRKDGSPVWALVNITLVEDEDGGGFLEGTAIDITERKRMEKDLQMIASVVQSSTDLIGFASLEGSVFFLNPAGRQILGLDKDEPMVVSVSDYVMDEDRERFRERVLPAVARDGRWEGETRFKHMKTGAPVPMWQSIFFVTEHGTNRRTALGTISRDMTERKREEHELRAAKEAAEAASRAKSEFLANMSHEIRTPMNGILGMTALALDTDISPEQREYLGMVKSSADSLLELINTILDFSKIEAGKLELESIEFNLRDTLEPTLRTLVLRAHEKSLALNYQVRPEVPETLVGDPGVLRQIVVNLVGNAIKFTEHGEVNVRVERESEEEGRACLHFRIEDTGIGIPVESQTGIFDAFAQADSSTTRRYGGTGLGLTISRRLVEMMGGRIWLESTLGKGTAFDFTAWLGKAGQTNPRAVDPLSPPGIHLPLPERRRGFHILLAEDNRVNQMLAVRLLEKRGHHVQVAGDGREALEKLGTADFDLVLMDVQMPVMGGFEATAAVREIEKSTGKHIPIVALTARAVTGDRERCLAAGMDGYVAKPIRPEELFEQIEALIPFVPVARVGT
jgi:PAS domain S-box-containing protein